MNDLINFCFEDQLVRVVTIDDEPWWIADDLAKILEYEHTPSMVRIVPKKWASVHSMYSSGQHRNVTIISEGGMWRVLGRSDKPAAERAQEWMFGEVMPSIRKTGKYELPGFRAEEASLPHQAWDANMINAVQAEMRMSRQLFGPQHTRQLWRYRRMPMFDHVVATVGEARAIEYRDEFLIPRLMAWLDDNGSPPPTLAEIVAGLGYDVEHEEARDRVRAAMQSEGWWSKKARRGDKTVTAWFPPEQGE